MILVTVGGQMPFDRLVLAVDRWVGERGRTDFLAQIGPGAQAPTSMQSLPFLTPSEFKARVSEADAVVSHAGMGTILTCLHLGTPVLVMPRRGSFQETRNDHQVATARRLAERGLVTVADDEDRLHEELDRLGSLAAPPRIDGQATPELLGTLRAFVHGARGGYNPSAGARFNDSR